MLEKFNSQIIIIFIYQERMSRNQEATLDVKTIAMLSKLPPKSLRFVVKITSNLLEHPDEQKYRSLNSLKLAKREHYEAEKSLLKMVGFSFTVSRSDNRFRLEVETVNLSVANAIIKFDAISQIRK